ncbi:TrmB family transcriptional regulator [Salmonella enterica]|nr:TrmB family transcriptional regulator [Salmonella enterica]
MLKQQDMTKEAQAVLNSISDYPRLITEIMERTQLSQARCQLILTQLIMAGLADYQCGCYKRLPVGGYKV